MTADRGCSIVTAVPLTVSIYLNYGGEGKDLWQYLAEQALYPCILSL